MDRERQTGTDRQTERETDRQTDRQTETDRDRERQREGGEKTGLNQERLQSCTSTVHKRTNQAQTSKRSARSM